MIFLNAANILYVVCYAVKDVLWLRIFCVVAILVIMPYYIWGAEVTQMGCILWNLVFLSINAFWIVVIVQQRRPPKMTAREKQLYDEVFCNSCSQREMLDILAVAKYVDFQESEEIVSRGSDPASLILIENGTANVLLDGKLLASLGRGDFIAEMSYLTGEPAVADVVALTSMTIIRWERSELEDLFEGNPNLKSTINEIIGRDLVQKIVSSESKLPELSVDTVAAD